jgi:hypothetical protein
LQATRQHIALQCLPRKADFMQHFTWLKHRRNENGPAKAGPRKH